MHKDQAWIIRNAHLWLDNEEPLYRLKEAWINNAKRRIENGTYQRELFIGGMERNLVPEVLKVMKEHGEFNDEDGPYKTVIPKSIKHAMAKSFARTIEYDARHLANLDKPSMLKKRGFILAGHGYHGIVSQKTKLIVGEAGKERVSVTPLVKTHVKDQSHGIFDAKHIKINMPKIKTPKFELKL